jgi:hypothetical protein
MKWLWVLLLCSGCASTTLLRQKDYQPVRENLRMDQPQLALTDFPTKREHGGFITTVERSYLRLLNGTPEPGPLVKVSDHLEDREVIRVSKELGHFFYNESEDGYLPAEHEVIWLHLIAGCSFAGQGDREGARVEASRAAHLLQGHYAERTGDFDDPGLRLLLAGLWLHCDEWEHARVDLRRAAEMDPRLRWAKQAAERTRPPEGLVLALVGVGPEPEWRPESTQSKLTSLGALRFQTENAFEKLKFSDVKDKHLTLSGPLSTGAWYDRHQRRNSEIRDIVLGSRYLSKAAGQTALTGTGVAATNVVSGTVMIVGVAAAVAIFAGGIYLLAASGASGAGEAVTGIAVLSLGVGKYAVDGAKRLHRDRMSALKTDWNETMDPSLSYRYVRFLPDQIFGGLGTQESYRLVKGNGLSILPALTLPGKTKIQLYFIPR